MKTLVLAIHNPAGELISHLPMDDVQIAEEGDLDGQPVEPRLWQEMEDMTDRILDALSQEGVTLAIDRLDLQLSLCEALLEPGDDPHITVRVPIADPDGPRTGDQPRTGEGSLNLDLDQLFSMLEGQDASN